MPYQAAAAEAAADLHAELLVIARGVESR